MVSSNEIFNWSLGQTYIADWVITDTDTGTVRTGTISVALKNIPQESVNHVGIVSYNGSLYLMADSALEYFSYEVSGCYDETANGIYNQLNTEKTSFSKGEIFATLNKNGVLFLANNNNSIPYLITGGFELEKEQIFDFWYNRILPGAISKGANAEGYATVAGSINTEATRIEDIVYNAGMGAHAEGVRSVASNIGSHAGGAESEANGFASFAHGYMNKANGDESVALGKQTIANGEGSLTLGEKTKAEGKNAITVGELTYASGDNSYAGGKETKAYGNESHAEGESSVAAADYSTAIGFNSNTEGIYSIAAGVNSSTHGRANVAIGDNIKTNGKYQAAVGRYNKPGMVNSDGVAEILFAVGDGNSEETRHNAFEVNQNGFAFNDATGNSRKISVVGNNLLLDGQGIQTTNQESNYYISKIQRITDDKFAVTVSDITNKDFSLTNNYNIVKDDEGKWLKLINARNGTSVTFIDVDFGL